MEFKVTFEYIFRREEVRKKTLHNVLNSNELESYKVISKQTQAGLIFMGGIMYSRIVIVKNSEKAF